MRWARITDSEDVGRRGQRGWLFIFSFIPQSATSFFNLCCLHSSSPLSTLDLRAGECCFDFSGLSTLDPSTLWLSTQSSPNNILAQPSPSKISTQPPPSMAPKEIKFQDHRSAFSRRKTMEHRQNTESSPSKRPSLKSGSQFNKYNIWKGKLRESCYKRVREDRTRLLWKMRLPTSQSCKQNQEDIVRSAFQDIVYDELKKMKESSLYNTIKDPTSDSKFDDLLWEYDGVHTSQGECEEILLEMQIIFYEDLKAEPKIEAIDCTSETWEDEEDEFLARALFEHMQLNADETHRQEIWCPICKQGELKESRDLIHCTRCELRLSKANELALDFLRDRLAEAHTEHFDKGCRLKPKFCLKTRFNLTALYISCEGCDTFEVVI